MAVKLHREIITRMYCHMFQAERSIHRALFSPWTVFQEYYRGERLRRLELLDMSVRSLLERHHLQVSLLFAQIDRDPLVTATDMPPLLREECGQLVYLYPAPTRLEEWLQPFVDLFRCSVGRILNHCRRQWSIPSAEAAFFGSAIHTALLMIRCAYRPAINQLIEIRMALSSCRTAIEQRCQGALDFATLHRLEHFQQSDCIVPVQMSDLVTEPQDLPSTFRQSA